MSETIETGERHHVDLETFECRDITRSTVLQRVCYDPAQQHLIVAANVLTIVIATSRPIRSSA